MDNLDQRGQGEMWTGQDQTRKNLRNGRAEGETY